MSWVSVCFKISLCALLADGQHGLIRAALTLRPTAALHHHKPWSLPRQGAICLVALLQSLVLQPTGYQESLVLNGKAQEGEEEEEQLFKWQREKQSGECIRKDTTRHNGQHSDTRLPVAPLLCLHKLFMKLEHSLCIHEASRSLCASSSIHYSP